jgi:fumarate hydratase class II
MEILTEQLQEQLIEKINLAVDHFEIAGNRISEAMEIFKCRQLQMIAADLASIADHIQSLASSGPLEPWAEIPLEQSEIVEEA